jgi:hypothetical protein
MAALRDRSISLRSAQEYWVKRFDASTNCQDAPKLLDCVQAFLSAG